ncbi:group 1 truncated hemoglobin [Candidatus Methylospira mobilis]|uniref:group I truncated hemoglobin n=1 Tax=Candidatus Methylospira mobilis TaxID=1808979 RepID=UPI0028EE1D6F|nr:group 1 truncated hemoglobin [Candidatus Methylospira mobilis]WNV04778.1 group 1 truncated hemoglobin [Candidatus Methylospira mobilis]
MTLFDEIGGFETLKRISKAFYDKVYAHPWLGQYFKLLPREQIEKQQADFIAQAIGGPDNYRGKAVISAHLHIFITEELFQIRESLLQAAFQETGAPAALIEKWNKIDQAFKPALISRSVAECSPRFPGDGILSFSAPEKTSAIK